ncbi:hypothetical protein PMIN06_001154 [Paraphaeosphaeria minitans]
MLNISCHLCLLASMEPSEFLPKSGLPGATVCFAFTWLEHVQAYRFLSVPISCRFLQREEDENNKTRRVCCKTHLWTRIPQDALCPAILALALHLDVTFGSPSGGCLVYSIAPFLHYRNLLKSFRPIDLVNHAACTAVS